MTSPVATKAVERDPAMDAPGGAPTDIRSLDAGRGDERPTRWSPGALIILLVATNVVLNRVIPDWAYLPSFIVAGAAALLIAHRGGASMTDLGLGRGAAGRSALVGLAAGTVAALLIFTNLGVPAFDGLYEDSRADGLGVAGLVYHAVIRIPLGTALGEEILFRGALLGVLLTTSRRWTAIALSALLFGFWHVLPTISVQTANESLSSLPMWAVIPGGVVSTALVGVVFAWMRIRTRHLAAPVIFHAMVNASALIAAYISTG
ncbi:MAG TPA: type II CAAX endopeptidase family protein [Acidimicrobiia bacterium]|nr:type II CAAX endopeptidase family protein [Acidimicrobiia bacterium]